MLQQTELGGPQRTGRGRLAQTDGGVRPEMGPGFWQPVVVPLENFALFSARDADFMRKIDVSHPIGSVLLGAQTGIKTSPDVTRIACGL